MRTLTPAALASILQLEGTEPLIVVGIEWVAGTVTYYCDKEIEGVKGKILSISNIESVIAGNSKVDNLTIELDDTDGELKSIIDIVNIHKINVSVYQFYTAMADKFLLFKGQIQTPFTWTELGRSIGFTIASEIESFEVGFSPEEGQLEFVTDENIGKPWPLAFGSVVHSPAVRVGKGLEGYAEGILLEDLGIVDPMLEYKLASLQEAFNQSKLLFLYWLVVINQSGAMSRKAGEILPDYLSIIQNQRVNWAMISGLAIEINKWNDALKKGGLVGEQLFKSVEKGLKQNQLTAAAGASHQIAVKKLSVEDEVDLCEFKISIMKDAYNKAIDEYNNMRSIYYQYILTQNEICRQSKIVKTSILIRDGSKFVQETDIDIYINRARFRGQFDGDMFNIGAGPLYTYANVLVAPWVPNDDPCEPEDENNGLSVFYLAEEPPLDLNGMWLLVKKKGDQDGIRHLLHVQRQEGTKIIFDIIPIDSSSGGGQSTSINDLIGKMLDVPLVNSPFGIVPTDLLTGDWDASKWNSPQGEELIQIINSIPGGPNPQELRNLARLVFLKQYDSFGNDLILIAPTARESFMLIGEDVESISEVSPTPLKSWFENYTIYREEWPDSALWVADSGSKVSTSDKDCDLYIVNILPSTIHGVFAYRKLNNGKRVLVAVPSSYYVKNESANLGTIDVTCLTFPTSLSSYEDEGWEDEVYVTFTSSVGPNVVDVIEHLIETYSDATVNVANFAAIKAKFKDGDDELYPVSFTLLERPNVLAEIERIAWEARCAIYRKGSEFFLKYLAEEPTADIIITESDIDNSSHYNLVFPETEELITRMVCTWFPDYLPPESGKPYQLIFRHNVKLYGLHTEDITFHIYNIKELVEKSATFWLIRRANTWKRVTFKTFLTKLEAEVFDTVSLELVNPTVCNTDVKGVLLNATYDPNDNSISMEVEVPVKSGEMDIYNLYWPANVAAETLFPKVIEIEKGYAGGYGPGAGVTGTINDCEG
jgi:hypothetical protein